MDALLVLPPVWPTAVLAPPIPPDEFVDAPPLENVALELTEDSALVPPEADALLELPPDAEEPPSENKAVLLDDDPQPKCASPSASIELSTNNLVRGQFGKRMEYLFGL